jgi:flavin-dependent dehydrogenase
LNVSTTASIAHLNSADVLIDGAGPAGLSCAIAAANQGLQVEIVDAMQPGIDKACGEGLMEAQRFTPT